MHGKITIDANLKWARWVGPGVNLLTTHQLVDDIYEMLSEDYPQRCGGNARSRWIVSCTARHNMYAAFEISPVR
ncbi:hypothetical protein GCM10011374_03340 [Kocuria dechangensis]|uniref:Uncharacterized protein n=1 Tax=Kocuria dechangensis TaxID=1176249 RepID=A0A917GGF5_9MICC|nr:hypothetical protein [Kocuria dechangensis]GGG44372.1 hypothetical protein GCM10011374_03340 [Kocuria dechangensis]